MEGNLNLINGSETGCGFRLRRVDGIYILTVLARGSFKEYVVHPYVDDGVIRLAEFPYVFELPKQEIDVVAEFVNAVKNGYVIKPENGIYHWLEIFKPKDYGGSKLFVLHGSRLIKKFPAHMLLTFPKSLAEVVRVEFDGDWFKVELKYLRPEAAGPVLEVFAKPWNGIRLDSNGSVIDESFEF
jgi:hypothetical protein